MTAPMIQKIGRKIPKKNIHPCPFLSVIGSPEGDERSRDTGRRAVANAPAAAMDSPDCRLLESSVVQREQRGSRHAVLQASHAARRSVEPNGIRSSSAPTRRRKARICCRVTLSRGSTEPAMSSRSLGQSWPARVCEFQECHMKTGSGANQCPALHLDARSDLSRNSCSLGGREKPSQSRRALRVTMTFIEPSLRVAGERASSRNRHADAVLPSFCLRQRRRASEALRRS